MLLPNRCLFKLLFFFFFFFFFGGGGGGVSPRLYRIFHYLVLIGRVKCA